MVEESQHKEKTKLCSTTLHKVVGAKNEEFKLSDAIKNAMAAPLMRIKVHSEKSETINPRLFGNSYRGSIANPNDILRFWSSKKETLDHTTSVTYSKSVKDIVLASIQDNCHLSLLLESELNEVVNKYALGMETQVINEYIRNRVVYIQNYLKERMREAVNEQLSDDLYQQIIERTVVAKTREERSSFGSSKPSIKLLCDDIEDVRDNSLEAKVGDVQFKTDSRDVEAKANFTPDIRLSLFPNFVPSRTDCGTPSANPAKKKRGRPLKNAQSVIKVSSIDSRTVNKVKRTSRSQHNGVVAIANTKGYKNTIIDLFSRKTNTNKYSM